MHLACQDPHPGDGWHVVTLGSRSLDGNPAFEVVPCAPLAMDGIILSPAIYGVVSSLRLQFIKASRTLRDTRLDSWMKKDLEDSKKVDCLLSPIYHCLHVAITAFVIPAAFNDSAGY